VVSQENVEIFRAMTDAVNVPDPSEATIASLIAPDFSIENVVTAVTDKTYHGAAGCVEWWRDLSDTFAAGARYEVEAIIAEADDLVVGRVAIAGTAARSGAPLRLRWVTVTWFEDGKATRSVGYANRHEALKAVGLEE
jgi:ketosteroid isomerase-like protein